MTEPTPEHGCMIDGQPAMPILISEYNTLVAQANEAEQRLRNIAQGGPRADSIQAEIGEMIAQTHELRDQIRAVRAAIHIADAEDVTDWQRGYRACAEHALTALDEPGPTATQATEPADHVYLSTGCHHGDHGYCQSMTGLNGSKRPGECKHCGAKCQCGCHATAKET